MDDQLYACTFPYYSSYTSSASDFTTTTSTSPPPQQHNHHPSPLPPPLNSSIISSSDDFLSFQYHDHDQPMLFGSSVVEPSFFSPDEDLSSAMLRARIAAHPLYSRLLQSYIDCQKVSLLSSNCVSNDLIASSSSVTKAIWISLID